MASSVEEVESENLGSLGIVMDEVISNLASSWDPLSSPDWDKEKPSKQCILRIKRDIMSIYNEPPPCMCIVPDKDDITRIHALITGPFDTPYEGGFFYFLIRCPPDYPIRPPRVKLMTTGNGQVRFNPNLYKNGKVCLSILGTWSGPAWSPAQSLSSVLISIQSLMNEKPYHNEPGFERERMSGDVKRYSDIIRHETLRVAVCDMLEGNSSCPAALQEVMETSFNDYFDYYKSVCKNNSFLQGQSMQDPFGERRGSFDYTNLLRRLEAIKVKLADKICDSSDDSSDSEMDTSMNESANESTNKPSVVGKSDEESKDSEARTESASTETRGVKEEKKTVFTNGQSTSDSKPCDSTVQSTEVTSLSTSASAPQSRGACASSSGTNVDNCGSSVDPFIYSGKPESSMR